MARTPFPARPVDVVPLTAHEFMPDLTADGTSSLDAVCARFVEDANRALVWMIRYRALTAWVDEARGAASLPVEAPTPRDICEIAAAFGLNDRWQFDTAAFSAAVAARVSRRPGHGSGQ